MHREWLLRQKKHSPAEIEDFVGKLPSYLSRRAYEIGRPPASKNNSQIPQGETQLKIRKRKTYFRRGSQRKQAEETWQEDLSQIHFEGPSDHPFENGSTFPCELPPVRQELQQGENGRVYTCI